MLFFKSRKDISWCFSIFWFWFFPNNIVNSYRDTATSFSTKNVKWNINSTVKHFTCLVSVGKWTQKMNRIFLQQYVMYKSMYHTFSTGNIKFSWCYCTFVPPGVRVTVAKAFSRVFSWRVINSKRVVGEGGTKDIDSKNALVAMLIKSCLDKQLEVFSNNTRINYTIISGEKSFTFLGLTPSLNIMLELL